jgi:hypothetical protein
MMTSIRKGTAVAALAFLVTTLLPVGVVIAHEGKSPAPSAESTAVGRGAFQDAMRKLWEDHIAWTRLYIVSAATAAADLPDIEATAGRLLSNQVDIGEAIKPFYGDGAGDQLTALLTDHILTAVEIISSAKAGESETLDAAVATWYANADEIATFLSGANPDNWPLDAMKAHMKSHLDLTFEEAVARLEGRYADDILAYDKVHADILEMADMLSDGIISQFPDSFAD